MSNSAIIAMRNVEKHYELGTTIVRALRGIDLEIETGEFAAIAGPSGSGKTTLLNLIGCMDVASQGDVIVAGANTTGLNDRALTDLRLRTLGFIFQSFNLMNVLTVQQNVELPLTLQGELSGEERAARARQMIEAVGLGSHGAHRPNELSGGQRQRVAIARALVTRPKIVLADEPTANLDTKTGYQIIDLMKEMNQTHGTTFIFSTHDYKVLEYAGRVIELVDGQLASSSTAEE